MQFYLLCLQNKKKTEKKQAKYTLSGCQRLADFFRFPLFTTNPKPSFCNPNTNTKNTKAELSYDHLKLWTVLSLSLSLSLCSSKGIVTFKHPIHKVSRVLSISHIRKILYKSTNPKTCQLFQRFL
jgi:hypothetical protein